MQVMVAGTPVHTRTLAVVLEEAGGGRLAGRGQILDLRKRGLVPLGGDLQTAGIIHDMRVDAEIEREGPTLTAIGARQDSVAMEPTAETGGECCRDPVRRIEALAGSPLDALYPRRLADTIGGPRGCSHVLTLAQLLGSTAATALTRDGEHFGPHPERAHGTRLFDRSLSLDSVQDAETLHASIQLADVHFVPAPQADREFSALSSQHEIRVHAELELGSMKIRALRVAERRNALQQPGTWGDRDADVASLVGRPALGGMAGALFEQLGDRPDDRPLLDCLLNLAPLMIQSMAALVDRWTVTQETRNAMFAAGGGRADSCYMMRSDGPLMQRMRASVETKKRATASGS